VTIINNTYGFAFIHIPRCGGTTVELALSSLNHWTDIELGSTLFGQKVNVHYWTRFGLHKHSMAKQISNVIGHAGWSRFYKFALVRNPIARAVSIFEFVKSRPGTYQCPQADFNDFVRANVGHNRGPDELLRPQLHWVTDAKGRLIVDQVFHMEQVLLDPDAVVARLGLPRDVASSIRFGHANRSVIRVEPSTIETDAIESLRRVYAPDFEAFGYSQEWPYNGM
jgi:hypothetical protein